jgi:hypothetical protein
MKYSLRSLMAVFDDPQVSRFRRRLKERVSEPCRDCGVAEAALRQVFEKQLDYPNLLFSDDLIGNDPDLPIEEILKEAFELLGINAIATYDSWNGTFGDLVRVLDDKVAKSHGKPRRKPN